ncbi:MAG: hypothetical protein CBB87_05790 [Micavibrio sp. TMED27]|nr:hypothetical protein [Micavibrio sp.]OUT91529.1 MAG: hypothetical protein CBB87_05790 [Micavibrio sp. TMED27]|tara:strand:+ start:2438 stop:2647 length:210 start_codon:yes stop_codon:yes gene_type:complete
MEDLHGHTKKPLLKVIRKKCIDCCAGKYSEVQKCAAKDCDLWPYRMGKNPFHKRKMTNEQKQAAAQRLK